MSKQHPKGQTLIETLAAIFILTMGVTAGVGLADYALGASTSITKDVIGTGLAREGIEIVKNMRDTNWLQAGPINTNCYDFGNPSANDGNCYKTWLTQNNYGAAVWGPGYSSTLNPSNNNPTPYIVTFFGTDSVSPPATNWLAPYVNWGLYPSSSSTPDQDLCANNTLPYALAFSSSTPQQAYGSDYGAGYYAPVCKASAGNSGFYRKITLQVLTNAPFNESDTKNDLAELYVKSQVWWVDNKRCGPSADWPGAGKCSVEIDTYLTNWKTY